MKMTEELLRNLIKEELDKKVEEELDEGECEEGSPEQAVNASENDAVIVRVNPGQFTSAKLEEIIGEEVGKVTEFNLPGSSQRKMNKAVKGITQGAAVTAQRKNAEETGESGITAMERIVILQLKTKLAQAAAAGNILTGSFSTLLTRLGTEIDKLVGKKTRQQSSLGPAEDAPVEKARTQTT